MFFQFYFWEQSKIQPRGQTFCIKNISLAFEDLFCWEARNVTSLKH
jgi:hypothetical protein